MDNLKQEKDNLARSLPPLTWFRAFESAARNLSFTAAAQELGLTQSAISQQVSALESRFGCLLFIRKNRGLALTDEGRRLVPTVTQAMATLRLATDSFDIETDSQLTVATSVSIAQWYLVPRMQVFSKANGNVAIRLMTKVWPDEFSNSSSDVEIRFDSTQSAGQNSVALGSSQSVLVCSPALLEGMVSVEPVTEIVARVPLIQVVGTADTWQIWGQSSQYTGEIKPSSLVDSHGMAVDLARAGGGIALTSRAIAAPALCDGSLIQLKTPSLPAKDSYRLTILPTSNVELSTKFAAWLNNEVATSEAQIPT